MERRATASDGAGGAAVARVPGVAARMGVADALRFMDGIEHNRVASFPAEWQPLANLLRQLLDERVANVQTLSRIGGRQYLANPIEHYFPHIWEVHNANDLTRVNNLQQQLVMSASKRPLRGTQQFLMPRTVPSIRLGMQRGLRLVSTNPIELTMIKLREMDKFYFGTRMAQELKRTNIMHFYRSNRDRVPHGWELVGIKQGGVDSAFVGRRPMPGGGTRITGYWYAPRPVARVMNNYLSTRLYGSSSIYDTFRATGNAMNSLQLGLSFFHGVFTTLDVSISTAALGLEQVTRGEPVRGVANMLYGAVPVVPTVVNVWRGHRTYEAYFGPLGATPAYQRVVDAMIQAGGTAHMDRFFQIGRHSLLAGCARGRAAPASLTALSITPLPRRWRRSSATIHTKPY